MSTPRMLAQLGKMTQGSFVFNKNGDRVKKANGKWAQNPKESTMAFYGGIIVGSTNVSATKGKSRNNNVKARLRRKRAKA